jgi:hypothetical protein
VREMRIGENYEGNNPILRSFSSAACSSARVLLKSETISLLPSCLAS